MTTSARVTMRDVARASGVSQATVSFVLNDTANQTIPEATREKVRRAAAELGYVPNSIARALREGASRIVVLEVGGLPPGRSLDAFIAGMDAELAAAGHGLLVSYGSAATAIDAVSPRAVIDLPAINATPDGSMHGMAAHARVQIGHLAARGHRSIAVAVPEEGGLVFDATAGHVRAAATALDLPEPATLLVGAAETTAERLRALLGEGTTAVAGLDDDLAISVLAALIDLGLRAPDDLAVIGFGDTAQGALWRPRLTTVRIDAHMYGRRTARQVLGLSTADVKPAPAEVVGRDSA
ncbi:LacI family DNA-binding transcriptional regulator [Actinoplanes sp. NPDC023714]|uniref:LacI family DNA-binding transcriptional regulator n=1 Tax=Actinoplanes sp. NPDC023714 TaxID=3154322 RepID=UPI0033C6571D